MSTRFCFHILADGVVQGVGFRFFTERTANRYGLAGWVRNLPDGRVEMEVEGEEGALNGFLSEVRRGPAHARVTRVQVDRRPPTGQLQGFEVRF